MTLSAALLTQLVDKNEASRDWSLYRDHEKRELSFLAGVAAAMEHRRPTPEVTPEMADAMRCALAALRRGRPQIMGILVQQDFDFAISALTAALKEPHK